MDTPKKVGPVLSVVDYDAWGKGYMPPSEHILIDALSYRGARVALSFSLSREHQFWVVLQGPTALTRRQRKMLRELMDIWDNTDEPDAEAPQATEAPAAEHEAAE